MKNIIFIAPPAAGKGTQSKFIESNYNIPHISIGDLVRNVISENSNLGLELKKTVDEGKLINNTSFGQINAKQTSYYFNENKQYKTGLHPKDLVKAYFI